MQSCVGNKNKNCCFVVAVVLTLFFKRWVPKLTGTETEELECRKAMHCIQTQAVFCLLQLFTVQLNWTKLPVFFTYKKTKTGCFSFSFCSKQLINFIYLFIYLCFVHSFFLRLIMACRSIQNNCSLPVLQSITVCVLAINIVDKVNERKKREKE